MVQHLGDHSQRVDWLDLGGTVIVTITDVRSIAVLAMFVLPGEKTNDMLTEPNTERVKKH